MTSPHLNPTRSSRGLRFMPAVDTVDGHRVQVYESSAADFAGVWLQLDHSNVLLTAEVAWQLADQLRALVAEHYQGDATPEWAAP